MAKLLDLTGQEFGRLTVLRRAENSKGGKARWFCSCECGEQRVVCGAYLRSGNTTSCGCRQREVVSERNSRGPNTYRVWEDFVYFLLENRKGEVAGETRTNLGFFNMMRPYRWHLTGSGYVATRVEQPDGTRKRLFMHHLLLPDGDKCGLEVDHIDRDPSNNDIFNLRYCTRQQNQANKAPCSKSGYKGVCRNGQGWLAQIKKGGKKHYLGTFKTPGEAALAYNEKALEFFGEYAYLNTVTGVF